jgi:organic hydroperoxide reductase OsmC/OhrA
MLTQLARSSEARKIELRDVSMRVTPRFEQTGSIMADTARSRLIDVETSLHIDSSAAPETIAKLVATAERMCFLMDSIREPHEVRNSTSLNGEPLDS